ncbi:ABC transporter substrate-binding protein [Paenibacillus flagellatus]|uniref:ABC transporter substrate-binding protein n=1 Tax=Paenibacillus flagellatus TaxID=2211139 RepID=A0A2V5K4Q3_9BACL|nr:ABC transporter substrate-binding protein [Paenibacillus flagellatus]PYI54305.1 ABC transporter substrate-binding protein [Paenibacillus flagellatus]
MNPKQRFLVALTLGAAICLAAAGCGRSGQPAAAGPDKPAATAPTTSAAETYLSFEDQTGRKVVLNRKPERIVVLNTELLQLFEQVGGTMVGRATAPGVPVPERAKAAEEVGLISQVNMERVLGLKPDLVIGEPLFHTQLAPTMEQAGIPFAILTIKTMDDMRDNALLLGDIVGQADAAAAGVSRMNERIKQITDRVPDTKPTYALLTFMMNTVSLQKGSSIALDVADRLNMRNVAGSVESGLATESVPFSMEKLVELDPDFLFFVVHGTDEEGRQALRSNLQSNGAWTALRAVKADKYRFIPSELFVNNPGLELDRSFAYLARIVYPERFGAP